MILARRLARTTLLLASLLLAPAVAVSGSVAVRIIEPAPRAVLDGRNVIRAAVEAADGEVVTRVEFEVDGILIAAPETPPWRVVYDFGESDDIHLIRVIAHTGSGGTAEASVSTRPFRISEEAVVDLVRVFATVLDRKGRYVTDLARDDFTLVEDGRRQTISSFSRDRLPLAVQIVLDTSNTMKGRNIDEARRAAIRFIQGLEPGDRAGVVSFNNVVQQVQPVEEDMEAAERAVRKSFARGGTALYDALAESALKLAPFGQDYRLAMILLSDGRDEAYSGLTPGSLRTFEETLEEVIESGVILYAIGLGRKLGEQTDFYGKRTLFEVLDTLAVETGGRALFTQKAEKLGNAYERISEELRHHYSLSYRSSNTRRDGSWRAIDLRVAVPGMEIRARRGYYAPNEGPIP